VNACNKPLLKNWVNEFQKPNINATVNPAPMRTNATLVFPITINRYHTYTAIKLLNIKFTAS